MQCFLVFDHLNDVVYVKSDADFDAFLTQKWEADGLVLGGTGNENGASQVGSSMDYCNALVQFFSPLVTSQRIMTNQFSSPYAALNCEDGAVLVFAEYLSYVALLIGREDGLTETFLRRKLNVFLRLATFLCGPTLDVLKTATSEGNSRRKFLGELVEMWSVLYSRELSFLLEAEEQLITNSDLCSTWVKLLQNVLEKLRHGWPVEQCTACHAFILVNAKTLALYSSRNAGILSEADKLLLTVLACTRQKDLVRLKTRPTADAVKRNNGPRVGHPRQESSQSSDSEQFYSPCGSPLRASVGPSALSLDEGVCGAISSINIEKGVVQEYISSDRRPPEIETELTEGFVDIAAELACDLVFLQSSVSSLAPHVAHTAHIAPGIALVVVSMVNRHPLSNSLVRAIDALHEIQRTPVVCSAKATVDALDGIMRGIVESLKKQKGSSTEIDVNLKRLQASWNVTKRSGLLGFLSTRDTKSLSNRLERELGKLSSLLKLFFQKYCVHWFRKDVFLTATSGPLIDVQALVRYTLADYVDYLRVKAKQNISMAPYYSEFPGLVHFMYVDRVTNQITTPTVESDIHGNDVDFGSDERRVPGVVVGDFVWLKLYGMVCKAWEHLRLGHTSVVWRDNCFHYSYFIWFEDAVGNSFKPEVYSFSMDNFPLPGVISKNFFRQFIRTCFPSSHEFMRGYELFCVHLSTVPSAMVNQHARLLAAKMWEISGAAQSPVDLL